MNRNNSIAKEQRHSNETARKYEYKQADPSFILAKGLLFISAGNIPLWKCEIYAPFAFMLQ